MPYYGFSMETRGRWAKLPDGTFGVKTDGAAQRGREPLEMMEQYVQNQRNA